MFHFSELKVAKSNNAETQERLDVCSGFFKHLPQYIINQASCVIIDYQNRILLVKSLDNNSKSDLKSNSNFENSLETSLEGNLEVSLDGGLEGSLEGSLENNFENSLKHSWKLPGGIVNEESSPKLAIFKNLAELKIELPSKKLEQFCFVKTNIILQDQLDNSGKPLWDIKDAKVVFLYILEEGEDLINLNTNTKKLNQKSNYKWVEIQNLKTQLNQIYGLETLVDLVIQLLQDNVRVDL